MYHVFDHLFHVKTSLQVSDALKLKEKLLLLTSQQYRLTGDLDPEKDSTDHFIQALVGSLVIGIQFIIEHLVKFHFVAGFFSFPWPGIGCHLTKLLLIS